MGAVCNLFGDDAAQASVLSGADSNDFRLISKCRSLLPISNTTCKICVPSSVFPRYISDLESIKDPVEMCYEMYEQSFVAKRVPWRRVEVIGSDVLFGFECRGLMSEVT